MNPYLYDLIQSTGEISAADILLRVGVSVFFGGMIYFSYWLTHNGTMYSRKFNITLLTLTILTTTVMTVIGNNIALSLGMVGALSIIRFRTSIKDSRDTIYIFWTIIVGICCGVGDYVVVSAGSAAVFLVLLCFGRVKNENRMLLIIRAARSQEDAIRKMLFGLFAKPPQLKAQNTTEGTVEFIYEISRRQLRAAEGKINAAEKPQSLTEQIYALEQIEYVNLVVQSDEIA